jgi:hypothetical protein
VLGIPRRSSVTASGKGHGFRNRDWREPCQVLVSREIGNLDTGTHFDGNRVY